MWRPPHAIHHEIEPVRAPGADEIARAKLFTPLTLKSGLALADRTWVPAMVPWRATEDGFVTRDVIEWYGRFAEGAPAAIVIEATGVRDVPSGPLLRIGDDRFIPGLRSLVEEVRSKSRGRTRLFVQLIDFLAIRRRPEKRRFLEKFLCIDDDLRLKLGLIGSSDAEVRAALLALGDDELDRVLSPRDREALRFGMRERVTDLDRPHVRDLPKVLPGIFADAAARAKEAGFDGVELHYAHAYTMASFLSALNTRDDGYGGSREGRVRLPREVLRAVRDRVGDRYTVGARILCDEIVEGGSRVDDAAFFAVELCREGLDFLSLSTGGKFEDAKQPKVGEAAYPYTGQSGWECMPTVIADARGPFARNVPKQAIVRRAVREAGLDTPIVVAGGIGTFERAEGILQREEGDVIAAARQSLADPDWFEKLRLGRAAEIRRCSYTNYCEALDQRHRAVTCQLWDRQSLDEPGVSTVEDEGKKRRRLVAPRWNR